MLCLVVLLRFIYKATITKDRFGELAFLQKWSENQVKKQIIQYVEEHKQACYAGCTQTLDRCN